MLRAYLFGGLELTWDDDPVPPIPSTAARSLFAYLLTYRHLPHTRNLLIGMFWPDLPESTARRRLSKALWQIRRALRPLSGDLAQLQDKANGSLDAPKHFSAQAIPEFLTSEGDTVQVTPDLGSWLDIEEFTQLSVACVGGGAGTIQSCERCLTLYRGEFLSGYYDDWVIVERERLRGVLLEVLDRLLEGYKFRAEYERALAVARRLATEDPWREAVHREIMRLLHLLDRDAEALKQFKTCRRFLVRELGAEPSQETVSLVREIALRSDQSLAVDLPTAAAPTAILELDSSEATELPLVGRDEERRALLTQVEALMRGLGGVVLVEGDAGVGKTRLLQTIARDAEWRGAEVLSGAGGVVDGAAPYGLLVEALSEGLTPLRVSQLDQLVEGIWLRVLAPLLPPLASSLPDQIPAPQLDPAQEQTRLAAALGQLLGGWSQIAPLLLVVENLHWAGEDTLDLLARLPVAVAKHPVLIIGSYRGEEARALPEVWERIQKLDRAGVQRRLELGGLGQESTGELVRRCLGMAVAAPLFEARLYQETQGNPLFVLETLRTLHGEGLLTRDERGAWSTPWDESTDDYAELPLPRAVEQTIARRLDSLSASGRQTIQLAAVLGERFGFDLLGAAVDGEPQSLLADVHQLVQRRFLDETERDYRFSHDIIRRVTYDGIDAPLRSQLHRQAAQAFATLHPERVGTLGHHWMRAEEWEKAADYHQQAGERAQQVYAHVEAVTHYSQALAALERRQEPVDLARRFKVHLAREAVYDLLGERKAQAEDLRALEALAEQLVDEGPQAAKRRTELAIRQAKHARKTGDYPTAIAQAQAAIQFSQVAGDAHSEAAGHLLWGVILELQGIHKSARVQLEQSMTLAQQIEDQQLEADCLRSLGNVCLHTSDFAGSRIYYERVLHICHKIGDRRGEGTTLNNLGLVCLFQGDNAEAEIHLRQTLSIRRELGDRWGENVALHNLGLASWSQGDYVGSESFYQQALVISREIGDRQGESIALSNLARIFHYLGDDESAREHGQRSLLIAQEIGYRYVEGYALTYLGHALGGLGQLAEAAKAYRAAIALRRELDRHDLAVESQAGLVRVCLAQGDVTDAQGLVDEILDYLENDGPDGMVEPFQVYLTCYHVLRAGDDPRTPKVLVTAYNLLQEHAAKISDEGHRRLFLEKVAAHREIVAAYHELQARPQENQAQVRLPRADAPLGRPLHDDEYVTVAWTLAAPEDTDPRKVTRRRRRIVRLLREAQAQGATPSYNHLAQALGVSKRTIERDMAALSREHLDLPPTRGKMSA